MKVKKREISGRNQCYATTFRWSIQPKALSGRLMPKACQVRLTTRLNISIHKPQKTFLYVRTCTVISTSSQEHSYVQLNLCIVVTV